MRFDAFKARAESIFDEIPPDFKEGIDGLEVTRKTVPHPSIPDVFTLGECLSEHYPSEFGGAGEVRSLVALYYGSFLELSRSEDDWDWEAELEETITHEIRHHLEFLALDDSLGDLDRAEDENFARRDGDRFDPFFFRDGEEIEPGVFEVDGDLFIERSYEPGGAPIVVSVLGTELTIALPDTEADVHLLRIPEPPEEVEGDLVVVLVRRRNALKALIRLFRALPPEIMETDGEVLAARPLPESGRT